MCIHLRFINVGPRNHQLNSVLYAKLILVVHFKGGETPLFLCPKSFDFVGF